MVEDGISLCCFFCTSLPVFVYSAIKTYFYAKIAICCGNSLITMQNKWEVDFSLASGSSLRRFQKNHAHEYASCLRNLDRVIMLLDDGNSLRSLNRNPSFFRSEKRGVYRIGQTGLVGAKETRLYVYAAEREKVVYVLGMGTKESQTTDINDAHKAVKNLKK